MKYPCENCQKNGDPYCSSNSGGEAAGCTRWRLWFMDAWASARVGVMAKDLGLKKPPQSCNPETAPEKTTTHIIAEEG